MQRSDAAAPPERIPRVKNPNAIERMMNPNAHRRGSNDDLWHVLCTTLGACLWRGTHIIKNQFDLARYFHLIARIRPQAIVETGVQAGGSALFFMDCLDMMALHDALYVGVDIDADRSRARIVAREHNFVLIKRDCLAPETVDTVRETIAGMSPMIVILDSVHTQEHVEEELRLYAPLVPIGSYLVVEDTDHNGHPVLANYGPSAWEAVDEFLRSNAGRCFEHDREIEHMFGPFTNSTDGWLRRVS